MRKYIILTALCLISTCLLGFDSGDKILNPQEIEAEYNRYCVCLPGGCMCTPDEDEEK